WCARCESRLPSPRALLSGEGPRSGAPYSTRERSHGGVASTDDDEPTFHQRLEAHRTSRGTGASYLRPSVTMPGSAVTAPSEQCPPPPWLLLLLRSRAPCFRRARPCGRPSQTIGRPADTDRQPERSSRAPSRCAPR